MKSPELVKKDLMEQLVSNNNSSEPDLFLRPSEYREVELL